MSGFAGGMNYLKGLLLGQSGSAQVGHTDGAAGSVATTVAARLSAIVCAIGFATPQQAALAAIGKPFFVPAGAVITLAVGVDVASLAAAMSAVAQWVIPASATVTITVPAGQINAAGALVLNHPYGSRLFIQGAAVTNTTASAAGAVTGAAGAWSVPLTVASAAGIAVGQYVLVRNTVGTGQHRLFSGMCKVEAVAGNVVTVKNTAKNAAWPAATLTAADLTVIKTILKFTGCDGISVNGCIGGMDRVAIVGDKTPGTVGIISQRMAEGMKGKGYLYLGGSVGVSSFGDGGLYAQFGGTIDAAYVCVADCLVYNILAQHGGSVMANYAISSGSGEVGFAGSNSGDVSAEYSVAVGNGTYGYYTQSGGSLTCPYACAWANVSDGVRAAWGGSIRGQNVDAKYNGGAGVFAVGADIVVPNVSAVNNAGGGLYAEGGASIYASSAVCTTNAGYGIYADGAVVDCPQATASGNSVNGATAVNNGTILADQIGGTANGAYLCSASHGGYIRATNASAAGATLYADAEGVIDAAGATGAPTLTTGTNGVIFGATIRRGSMLLDSGANFAIGATHTAAHNIDKTGSVFHRMAKSGVLKTIFGIDDGGALIAEAANGDTSLRAEQTLWFSGGGANERGFIDAAGNAALGRKSLATNATDGFFYLPACAGTPTGAATAKAGRAPALIDTTNSRLWVNVGGMWKWTALN